MCGSWDYIGFLRDIGECISLVSSLTDDQLETLLQMVTVQRTSPPMLPLRNPKGPLPSIHILTQNH